MKKYILIAIASLLCFAAQAQRVLSGHPYQESNTIYNTQSAVLRGHSARTTAIGDTEIMSDIPAADTPLVLYTAGAGNGYLTGMDSFNDLGFAERYDFDGGDTSVQIIGLFAQFGGKVNPAAGDFVTLKIWDVSAPFVISANYYYSGYPGDILDTVEVPVNQLGIGTSGDTVKAYLFATPTAQLSASFYAGYTVNYNWSALDGDTIGIASSRNGDRTSPVQMSDSVSTTFISYYYGDSTATAVDTVINVQNATLQADYNWYDNYTQDDSLLTDLAVYPIIYVASSVNGVKGVTRNGLTLVGCFPDPATDHTNIEFALADATGVTIDITDMTGKALITISQPGLAAGGHTVAVNTAGLSAGDYLYLVRTATGAGMAGKLSVIK